MGSIEVTVVVILCIRGRIYIKIWASVFKIVKSPFQYGLRRRNEKCSGIHGVLEEAKLIYVGNLSAQ